MALLRAPWSYPAQPCLPLPDSHTTAECQHGRKPQSSATALSCSNQAICLVLLPLAPTLVPTSGPGPMLSCRVPVMVLPAGTLAAAKAAPLALRLWGCASCLCRGGVPAPPSSSVPAFLAKRKHNHSQVSCRTGAQCMAATATGKGGSMGRQHCWGATALGTHQPVPGWVWAGVKPQRPPQASVAARGPGSSCQSCSSSMLLLAPPAHGRLCLCSILCRAGPWPLLHAHSVGHVLPARRLRAEQCRHACCAQPTSHRGCCSCPGHNQQLWPGQLPAFVGQAAAQSQHNSVRALHQPQHFPPQQHAGFGQAMPICTAAVLCAQDRQPVPLLQLIAPLADTGTSLASLAWAELCLICHTGTLLVGARAAPSTGTSHGSREAQRGVGEPAATHSTALLQVLLGTGRAWGGEPGGTAGP